MDAYEVLKFLGEVEKRIHNIEDTMTSLAGFASDRRSLSAAVKDEALWALYELQQAKALVSTLTNNASNSPENNEKDPVNPSA